MFGIAAYSGVMKTSLYVSSCNLESVTSSGRQNPHVLYSHADPGHFDEFKLFSTASDCYRCIYRE